MPICKGKELISVNKSIAKQNGHPIPFSHIKNTELNSVQKQSATGMRNSLAIKTWWSWDQKEVILWYVTMSVFVNVKNKTGLTKVMNFI